MSGWGIHAPSFPTFHCATVSIVIEIVLKIGLEMGNPGIPETPWSLSLQHKLLAVTVKASHSPVAPASKSFVKDWYTKTKRGAINHAENVVAPILDQFNSCSSQSDLEPAYVDFEDAVKNPWLT